MAPVFSFSAPVWEHTGMAAWHFVSLPEEEADEIEATCGHRARGFGSLRVEVTVGSSRWTTSIFPDDARGTYLLPLKKAIRRAEGLVAGATAVVRLEVLDEG